MTRLALRIEWRFDFHAAAKPPMIATFGRYRFSNFVLTQVEIRNEKPKRPREPFRLLRGRFESNEEPGGEILRFAV